MSGQPFGYILLETDNGAPHTYRKISNVQEVCKPNVFYVRFDTTLQSLDCENRNKRIYNGDALVKGLSDPNLVELMYNNKWKGEATFSA